MTAIRKSTEADPEPLLRELAAALDKATPAQLENLAADCVTQARTSLTLNERRDWIALAHACLDVADVIEDHAVADDPDDDQ
jgi:hypothetical protein